MIKKNSKHPDSFWVIAAAAMLWYMLGVGLYLSDMFISEDKFLTLSKSLQNLYLETPIQLRIIHGLAVFAGLLGAQCLFLKKSWAVQLFLLSLLCMVLKLVGILAFTNTYNVLGSSSLIMPALSILVAAIFYWYSQFATKISQIAKA